MATTVSIYRTYGTELYIHFDTREHAYVWCLLFIQKWSDSAPTINKFEKKDSSSWGSLIMMDTFFEIFMFDGHGIHDRNVEWYNTMDMGYNIVDQSYAIQLGRHSEPCLCEDPCVH